MHINELPDVVLASVFYWTCNDPAHILNKDFITETWSAKLSLLAVCRIWRELALPCVHRVSFIRCICAKIPEKRHHNEMSNISDSDEHRNPGELVDLEKEMRVVKSNLDIIGNTGNKYWPRTIQLFIQPSNDQIHSLQLLVEKIRKHSTLLEKVMRIEIAYRRPAIIPRIDEAADIADASSTGEEFSQLMPHVQQVGFGGYTNLAVFVNFAQSIVKGYAHQLAKFIGSQTALGKVQSFSDNLRYVQIDGHRNTPYMPQICAENLTNLTLIYVKSDFDWSSFESNDSSRGLHFANLMWLRLIIDSEDNDDWETNEIRYFAREFNYKVIAPKLETVVLQLCPFTLSFLASIYGLVTIPDVKLTLKWDRFYFTEFDLDIARDKFASHARNSRDDFQTIDYHAYMNDVFNICSLAKSSIAIIESGDSLDFQRMDWKYLLNIEIYCTLHVNDLRTLVSKAPSLETIYISEIEIKEDGKLLSEIQDEAATVEMISPSLKSISFGYLTGSTKSERDKFMVYLSKLTLKD